MRLQLNRLLIGLLGRLERVAGLLNRLARPVAPDFVAHDQYDDQQYRDDNGQHDTERRARIARRVLLPTCGKGTRRMER